MNGENKVIKTKSNSILKLFAIGILGLILLIPTAMIQGLITERQARRDSALAEVSSKWGGIQDLAGPILTIPYKKMITTGTGADAKQIEETLYAHFLPDQLNITGQLDPETLQRGIYKVIAYNSQLNFAGEFSAPDMKSVDRDIKEVMWGDAVLSIGIPDMQGIKEGIKIKWDGKDYDARPGLGTSLASDQAIMMEKPVSFTNPARTVQDVNSGVNTRVPLTASTSVPKKVPFSFSLNLNGSQQLNFIPLGKETNVDLTSSWANPSFDGAFVPDEREVTNSGFKAKWKILQLNRNFAQSWTGDRNGEMLSTAFGVNLLVPVDEYQKNTRSVKYAIMFIALTFLIFFFAEMKNNIRIHPIHYILVGLALVLFFSLLLSISEQLSFNLAYLIASVSTLAMVTLYSRHIFKNNTLTLLQAGILVLIYGFIFTIIQLQDYALLVGNIGLFIILAVVMYISRKINWYDTENK